jgi:hypothetical protein
VRANIAGLENAEFLRHEQKEGVFYKNAEGLWEGKL